MDKFAPLQQCKRELPWRAYKYDVVGMSDVDTFLFVLVQSEASWPAENLPCLLGFWTPHSTNGAGAPCKRVMCQGSDTSAELSAPSCQLTLCPHVPLSLSGMHSLPHHTASQAQPFHSPLWFPLLVPLSDHDLSACCSLSEGQLCLCCVIGQSTAKNK